MVKLSHKAVDYGPGHRKGDHCAICANYEPPHCSIVADPIKPLGWCKRFSHASKEIEGRLSARDN